MKEFLCNEYGINVDYLSKYYNYYSVWIYVMKEDENFIESVGYLDFKNVCEFKISVVSCV